MKHRVSFSLVPRRDASALPDALQPIRIRVSYGGLRVDLRSGLSCEPSKWDASLGLMRAGTRNGNRQAAGEVNRALQGQAAQVDVILSRFEMLEGRAPTSAELLAAFNESQGRSVRGGSSDAEVIPFSALREFQREQGRLNDWTLATYNKFRALGHHLERFDARLTFGRLPAALPGFVAYLHRLKKRNTTIQKNVQLLRWFLRWCEKRGYLASGTAAAFDPKLKGTDGNQKELVYLEWEELMALYGLDLSGQDPMLAQVRDVFCFLCFTGLRYSDVAHLRRSDVGPDALRVVTQKTADGVIVELNKYSRALLERYAGQRFRGDLALPVLSNQRMNKRLKTLGILAGLDAPVRVVYFMGAERVEEVHPKHELLGTHCGRRTFVVNALRMGIPSEVIMRWTGHSSFASMRPYVKIVDKAKQEAMARFDSFGSDSGKAPEKAPENGGGA